jgi:hypothetical protein
MRNVLLAAAFVTSLGIPAAKAEDLTAQLSLSPQDPKYNSAECLSMREKGRNYDAGLLKQDPGTYVFMAVAPGGTAGFLAIQHRKREMFKAQIEEACMANPPNRHLDPSGGTGPGSEK